MLILKEWFNLVLCVNNHRTCPPPPPHTPPKKDILGNTPSPLDLHKLRIHYSGPLFGRMYLMVVDAFSKYCVKVAITHTASSKFNIEGLHHICL